jgi:hypothetical protein
MVERWIVAYRRYSSDEWRERVFRTEHAARKFAKDYLYDTDNFGSVIVRKFVEVKGGCNE